jgi:CBS domain-containing protein
MRADQIMTKDVITVAPLTPILDAADLMLRRRIGGLPVLDGNGALVGIVSQSDFLHRGEIGTERKRPRWLQFLIGTSGLAADFVREHGRRVQDVMTRDPVTVEEATQIDELVRLMEKHDVHRLPVMRGKILVGIITRSNLLQAVASMARDVPEPTADDDHIRDLIGHTLSAVSWRPESLQIIVRNGVVHLHGIVFDEQSRQATIVAAESEAGVKEVHDHLYTAEAYTGATVPVYYAGTDIESKDDSSAGGSS